MWKGIVAGTAVLAIVGTSVVYAQNRPWHDDDAGSWHHGWRDDDAGSWLRGWRDDDAGSWHRGWRDHDAAHWRYGWRDDDAARWRPGTEDLRAFGEARLAAFKAGLALTPEQENYWPAFEEAAREFAKLRLDRLEARDSPPPDDPIERMRRRAAAMSDGGAALRKLADATEPLYQSLDESQKRRFAMLSRFGGSRMGGPGYHFRGGPHGDGPYHFGPRRMNGGPAVFDRPEENNL